MFIRDCDWLLGEYITSFSRHFRTRVCTYVHANIYLSLDMSAEPRLSVVNFCSQLFWSNNLKSGHVGPFIVLPTCKSVEVIFLCWQQPATPIHSGQISFFYLNYCHLHFFDEISDSFCHWNCCLPALAEHRKFGNTSSSSSPVLRYKIIWSVFHENYIASSQLQKLV